MGGSHNFYPPPSTASPNSRGGFGGDNYGGGYQTSTSAFSMDPREDRSRKNWRLINQAKEVIRKENEREAKMA